MQLLYTGASKQGMIQINPDTSLGGFVSSSQIPNDTSSNIFSVASLLAIQNKRREVKMIAFKNNDGDTDNDLTFKFAIEDDSICKYKIAFVSPTVTDDGSCFEQIINAAALPYYATFIDIVNEQEINITSLANGAYLGMWLMREFNYDSDDLKKKTCVDWLAILEAGTQDQEPNQLERFSFTLDYTVGEPSVSTSIS